MDETNVCLAESQVTSISSINTASEESVCSQHLTSVRTRICLIGEISNDSRIIEAAQVFGVPVVSSASGSEFINDGSWDTVFVLEDFVGPVYEAIHASEQRILGPTALQQFAEKGQGLPNNSRPLYNLAMSGLVICFTGFRKKDELNRLINLIHNMGGSIRKDMVSKVTHLIANNCGGDKYQYAVTFRVPVMGETWVHSLWERRNDIALSATSEEMMSHKLKPFHGARVCFLGFPDDEKQHMTEVLQENGGTATELEDPSCSHVVVDSSDTYSLLKSNMLVPRPECLSPTFLTSPPHSSGANGCLQQNEICSLCNLNPGSSTCCCRLKNVCISSPISSDMTTESVRAVANYSTPMESSQVDCVHNLTTISECYSDCSINSSPRCKIQKLDPLVETVSSNVLPSSLDVPDNTSVSHSVNSSHFSFNCPMECVEPQSVLKEYPDDETCSFQDCEIDVQPSCSQSMLDNLDSSASNFQSISTTPNKKFNKSHSFRSSLSRKLSFGFSRSSHTRKSDLKLKLSSFSNDATVMLTSPLPENEDDVVPMSCDDYHQTQNPRIPSVEVPMKSCGTELDTKEGQAVTALVVDESVVQSIPEKAPVKAAIVKAEWFWMSIQNEGCADEKDYLFEDYLEALLSPGGRCSSQTPTASSSSTRARKRKRLREAMSRLVQIDSPASHKRRSSVSDAAMMSMSGSFLDCTTSPEKQSDEVEAVTSETPRKIQSPRQQVFMELVQTESNYVGILHTIMSMFKSPLENMSESEDYLLNNTELKIIFGNLPPIYEVHKQMLEELCWAASHWKEDFSIGNVFLKYAPDLIKAYPPFVNFFENTKEMLVKCDQTKPRFHAFLKICQTKPECGRQSLQELLIRPVQRLPSISLLLNDILKHTSKSNQDHGALEQALSSIREVMTHINEDKRKTEGQLVMFDIFNDIDNCPVCKKRSKAFNSLKSPNTTGSLHSMKLSNGKPYKHIRLMPLSNIKRVIDIREAEDCHNVFALMCRNNQELKEKLYSFTLADEETDKLAFLRTLCRQMANNICKADAENFLASLDSHQLDIDTSDVTLGTLSKAFKFASRTKMKVGRAFSFNKTPSKLKRAVSTMMSPFGSTTNLTPASQLAQMRLASCNNLNELGSSPIKEEPSYIAPMSVQPTRKNKCSSLNMAALRRL
ncbi:protein ECT2 isoform X2 [Periplaneta americana]|uniref:protein ECT2 isoform X2 n=1 Tax=Periplaneta americana TaxID=6978 RepID=UPI0037E909C9